MKHKHTYKTLRNLSPGSARRQVGARRRPLLLAISFVLTICSLSWPRAVDAAVTAIPGLPQWESQMVSFGKLHCTTLSTATDQYGNVQSYDQLLNATYYDATLVYLQIAKYTNDASWQACANSAKNVYRDRYVLGNNGQVPGYWNFTNGLTLDSQVNVDVTSKNAAILLSQNAMYAGTWTPLEYTASADRARELAYTIRAYLNAEKLGVPRRARLADLVNQELGHIDQWFVTKLYRQPVSSPAFYADGLYYIQPFMVGLTMEGLIMYHEATGDARVMPSVKVALDWLWVNAWVSADQAFWYENMVSDPSVSFPQRAGAPDLNLLIAPAYAWYYKMTGDTVYRDRGDQIFEGGVKGAYLWGAKQFNQNYSYGFEYVSRRRAGDTRTTQPTASTSPSDSSITTVGPATSDSVPVIADVVVSPAPLTPAPSAPSSSITSPSGDDSKTPQPKKGHARKCKYSMSVAC